MRVLVACEESQAVCIAFREQGHEAYSCDIQPCSGGHPEWHIQDDALVLISEGGWDIIIAHPPCTYLTAAGAVRLYNADHTIADPERLEKGRTAARFFRSIWDCDCQRIAIENPVPMSVFGLPRYSQIIEPYMFGDPWRKRTCLWLKNLPPLVAMMEARWSRGAYGWAARRRGATRLSNSGMSCTVTGTQSDGARLSRASRGQWRFSGDH